MAYTVRKNDTWTSIAQDLYGDSRQAQHLAQVNKNVVPRAGMVVNTPTAQTNAQQAPKPTYSTQGTTQGPAYGMPGYNWAGNGPAVTPPKTIDPSLKGLGGNQNTYTEPAWITNLKASAQNNANPPSIGGINQNPYGGNQGNQYLVPNFSTTLGGAEGQVPPVYPSTNPKWIGGINQNPFNGNQGNTQLWPNFSTTLGGAEGQVPQPGTLTPSGVSNVTGTYYQNLNLTQQSGGVQDYWAQYAQKKGDTKPGVNPFVQSTGHPAPVINPNPYGPPAPPTYGPPAPTQQTTTKPQQTTTKPQQTYQTAANYGQPGYNWSGQSEFDPLKYFEETGIARGISKNTILWLEGFAPERVAATNKPKIFADMGNYYGGGSGYTRGGGGGGYGGSSYQSSFSLGLTNWRI